MGPSFLNCINEYLTAVHIHQKPLTEEKNFFQSCIDAVVKFIEDLTKPETDHGNTTVITEEPATTEEIQDRLAITEAMVSVLFQPFEHGTFQKPEFPGQKQACLQTKTFTDSNGTSFRLQEKGHQIQLIADKDVYGTALLTFPDFTSLQELREAVTASTKNTINSIRTDQVQHNSNKFRLLEAKHVINHPNDYSMQEVLTAARYLLEETDKSVFKNNKNPDSDIAKSLNYFVSFAKTNDIIKKAPEEIVKPAYEEIIRNPQHYHKQCVQEIALKALESPSGFSPDVISAAMNFLYSNPPGNVKDRLRFARVIVNNAKNQKIGNVLAAMDYILNAAIKTAEANGQTLTKADCVLMIIKNEKQYSKALVRSAMCYMVEESKIMEEEIVSAFFSINDLKTAIGHIKLNKDDFHQDTVDKAEKLTPPSPKFSRIFPEKKVS